MIWVQIPPSPPVQKPVEKAEVALLAGFCYYGDIMNNIKRCFWISKFKISKKEILNYYSIYSLDDSISINDVVIRYCQELCANSFAGSG